MNNVRNVRNTNNVNPYKIIVITNGWVLAGYVQPAVSFDAQGLKVTEGSVIRNWGTTAGLGQLAITGRTSETVTDPFGDGFVPASQILFTIDCANPL